MTSMSSTVWLATTGTKRPPIETNECLTTEEHWKCRKPGQHDQRTPKTYCDTYMVPETTNFIYNQNNPDQTNRTSKPTATATWQAVKQQEHQQQ
eukprot:4043341-Amphidinium_carterae.1